MRFLDAVEARLAERMRRAVSSRAAGWALTVGVGLLLVGGMWSPWFGGR